MVDEAAAPAGPRRLFREPAKVSTIKCGACGGPITLRTFGAAERIACSFCGALLEVGEGGVLAVIHALARKQRAAALPLHARGELDGVLWEVIGICVRSCVVDRVRYPWEEFLLYNPFHGFRWLVHALTDGHWTFGEALDASPLTGGGGTLELRGQVYRHFQRAVATVDYVEGEFTWRVEVGDEARVDDYVAPPLAISIERSASDDGDEVSRTIQRSIGVEEVWRAFDRPGPRPTTTGVGMIEVNPWWIAPRLAFAWVIVAAIGCVGAALGRSEALLTMKAPADSGVTTLAEPLSITQATALEIEVEVPFLDNQWRDFEGMLIDQASEEALGFDIEVSYYSGVDGGEHWSEGSIRGSAVLGDVAPGHYILQVNAVTSEPGAESRAWSVTATRGVFLWRYAIALGLLLLTSLGLPTALARRFERRRWENSDHAP